MPARHWGDLKTTDFDRLDPATTVAILPLAAIEQYGPHLPVSTDTSIMQGMIETAFPLVGQGVTALFLPIEAVAKSKGDLALVSATSSHTPWWIALEGNTAPKIIARLPFVERADHPAALPVFVISRVADDARVTEIETWSVRVSGWNAQTARALSPLAEILVVPDTAFDGAALLISIDGSVGLEKIKSALIESGASVRSTALVGSHATRYRVPPNGAARS